MLSFGQLDVHPCLLAPSNVYMSTQNQEAPSRTVWTLSYSIVIRHTTEEVDYACMEAIEPSRAQETSRLQDCIMSELKEALMKHSWFTGFDIFDEPPMNFSLEKWVKHAKESQAIVFIAVVFDLENCKALDLDSWTVLPSLACRL